MADNLCGSPLLPGPDNFEFIYGQQVTRLDNSTFRVYDFFGTNQREAKALCQFILTTYGGDPVLRIVYPRKEVICCVRGLDSLTILILLLLGICLLCAVVVGYYNMVSPLKSSVSTVVRRRNLQSPPYVSVEMEQSEEILKLSTEYY